MHRLRNCRRFAVAVGGESSPFDTGKPTVAQFNKVNRPAGRN
jgi:hypothetical protein